MNQNNNHNTGPVQANGTKAPSLGARLTALWSKRKKAPGFGILLFYVHMAMFFTAYLRRTLPLEDGLPLFVELGPYYIPLMFILTTLSLFLRPAFSLGVGCGAVHTLIGFATLGPFALQGHPDASIWLLALAGLALLIAAAIFRRASAYSNLA